MALPEVVNSWIWHIEHKKYSFKDIWGEQAQNIGHNKIIFFDCSVVPHLYCSSDSLLPSFFFFLLLIERPWRGTQAANSLINMMPDVLIDCPYDGECWEVFE